MRSRDNREGVRGRAVGHPAFMGLLLAFALALSYVESLIPFFFGVPGMKLGLPNFAVVVLLFLGDPAAALLVNLLRIVLSGFLFGSMFGILFSAAGAFVSFAAMVFMKRTGRFGVMGVSVGGGVAHNIGQLVIAAGIVKTSGILYYTPFLISAGAVTGALIGVCAGAALSGLRKALPGWRVSAPKEEDKEEGAL